MTFQASQKIAATANPQAVLNRDAFTRAVEIVSEVVERRNTLPILSNLRLRGTGETMEIAATDCDLELVTIIGGAVDSRFNTTIPAHGLKSYLKKARKSEYAALTMLTDPPSVSLEFDAVKYEIQAIEGSEYPDFAWIKDANDLHKFTISGEQLQSALSGTMNAISTEETRYYLNGLYMECVDDCLRFVATDGHKLFMQDLAKPEWLTQDMPGVIIPRKAVKLIQKLTKGKSQPETVDFEVSESKIRLSLTFPDGIKFIVTTKTIDGAFPDYQRVVPQHNSIKAVVDVADLSGAVQDVSLISSERGRAVHMLVNDGKIDVSVNNPDQGTAKATVAANVDCDDLEIGFNNQYLQAIFKEIEGESVTIEFEDSGSPTVFKGARDGWKAVQMPMRV